MLLLKNKNYRVKWLDVFFDNLYVNKYAESIAKAIHVPYRP